MERYFLDKQGRPTRRMQGPSGGGRFELGKEVLAQRGNPVTNYAEVYAQMFKLRFVRVVERQNAVEIEHATELTKPQERFLAALTASGKEVRKVTVQGR